jgi:hypothetical protein
MSDARTLERAIRLAERRLVVRVDRVLVFTHAPHSDAEEEEAHVS